MFLFFCVSAISMGFTIFLLLRSSYTSEVHHSSSLVPSQLDISGLHSFSSLLSSSNISGVHHSSSLLRSSYVDVWASPFFLSAFPAISLGFTIFLLFCVLSHIPWLQNFSSLLRDCNISGVHQSSSLLRSSCISGVHHFSSLLRPIYIGLWASPFFFYSAFQAISLEFTILLLFCVPSYISGVYHSSSLLRSQLCLWGALFFFFCVPPMSLRFTFLLLLRPQLYLKGSLFFLISSTFPAISLGFTIFLLV